MFLYSAVNLISTDLSVNWRMNHLFYLVSSLLFSNSLSLFKYWFFQNICPSDHLWLSLITFFKLIFCAFCLYSIIMLTVDPQYINCRLNHLDSLIFSAVLLCFFQNTAQKALTKATYFAQYASFNQSESCKFGCIIQSNLHNCAFLLLEQATEFSQSEGCKLSYTIQYILHDFKISQSAVCKFD